MPVVLDTLLVQLLGDGFSGQICLFHEFFLGTLGCPLEWSKGLRYEEGGTGDNLYSAVDTFLLRDRIEESGCDLIGQFSNAADILLGFSGMSQHEIQLDSGPAALESQRGTMQDHFFRQSFIDDITQSLAAGLRSKGQTGFFHILHLTHDIQGKGIDT